MMIIFRSKTKERKRDKAKRGREQKSDRKMEGGREKEIYMQGCDLGCLPVALYHGGNPPADGILSPEIYNNNITSSLRLLF